MAVKHVVVDVEGMNAKEVVEMLANSRLIATMPVSDTTEVIIAAAGTTKPEMRSILKKLLD